VNTKASTSAKITGHKDEVMLNQAGMPMFADVLRLFCFFFEGKVR